ncbi:MAG: hypothetical protein ACR2OT_02525 [Parvibaculales bacterium]
MGKSGTKSKTDGAWKKNRVQPRQAVGDPSQAAAHYASKASIIDAVKALVARSAT